MNYTSSPVLFHLGRDPGEKYPIEYNKAKITSFKYYRSQVTVFLSLNLNVQPVQSNLF